MRLTSNQANFWHDTLNSVLITSDSGYKFSYWSKFTMWVKIKYIENNIMIQNELNWIHRVQKSYPSGAEVLQKRSKSCKRISVNMYKTSEKQNWCRSLQFINLTKSNTLYKFRIIHLTITFILSHWTLE